MAISNDSKQWFIQAVSKPEVANEILDAIESGSNPQAATVAAISSTNLTVAAVAPSTVAAVVTGGAPDCSAAAIDTVFASVKAILDIKADNADLETLRGEVEIRLDAVEAKINAILVSLKNAGLML